MGSTRDNERNTVLLADANADLQLKNLELEMVLEWSVELRRLLVTVDAAVSRSIADLLNAATDFKLRLERDTAAMLERLRSEVSRTAGEVDALRAERDRLLREVQSLREELARLKLVSTRRNDSPPRTDHSDERAA